MKLRRALAAAAATAAMAPLALFAAPSAFADDSPSPAAAESSPAADDTTPAPADSSPAADDSTPADAGSTPATTTPTSASASAPASSSASASSSATATSSPSASESGEPVDECPVDENGDDIVDISDVLHSSLTGLPESVVAGSGWTNFKFNVSNSSDETIKDIQPFVGVGAVDWDFEKDYSDLVTVQVKQGGSWVDVATQFGEGGSFNAFSLGGGDSLSYQLRVKVDREVPSAVGIAIGLAEYSDDKACWISDDENYGIYYFEVLPAGSDAGKPNDAKPQTGGKNPISDTNDLDVDGQLAETGSSSALPVLGLVGGFAVVAGTGVVFAVKRRKGAMGAHA
ncbi:LPXTG cell wall anchor domain-containing protein [Streptomyces sp. NBC_00285]|uniref:LPXTG cell wall anchor domain-containing protein n=1 Tax=Streptomyces sp. NBC_00285 TaxID=2975700 RepID=UPI002E2D621D|nr:LPXTG cell wall anchor domain-containing protein [Streptomyces sp. NBC_00285]